jgi:hypothetical protein
MNLVWNVMCQLVIKHCGRGFGGQHFQFPRLGFLCFVYTHPLKAAGQRVDRHEATENACYVVQ